MLESFHYSNDMCFVNHAAGTHTHTTLMITYNTKYCFQTKWIYIYRKKIQGKFHHLAHVCLAFLYNSLFCASPQGIRWKKNNIIWLIFFCTISFFIFFIYTRKRWSPLNISKKYKGKQKSFQSIFNSQWNCFFLFVKMIKKLFKKLLWFND